MAITTLNDPFAGTKKPEDEMPFAELPASEVGGGAAMPVLSSAMDVDSPEMKAAANLAKSQSQAAQTHGAPDPTRGLMDRAPSPPVAIPGPGMSRTAEQAVASGTVIPGKIETDSVTTTVKSPERSGKVQSDETKGADRDLQFQTKRIEDAANTQMDAEAKIDKIALDAESKRNAIQAENEAREAAERQAAEDRRIASETFADRELENADAKVREKQDAAINWNKGKTPFKILNAVIRAAAMKDAYIMNPKGDPSDNPVAKTIDAALAEEKEAKQKEFLASKEWRDALKTKNAEVIKRTYDRETAKINIEVSARAKALLQSEKADQLATRTAKLDPTGEYYVASKDLALAKIAADNARDRRTLAMNYDPTVTSGGTTTTTLKKTTEGTKNDALRGTPEEVRGVPDINGKVVGLAPTKEEAVKIREEYGRVKPIMGALDKVSNLVTETGFWERVPGVSGFTDKQQQIKGLTDTMLAPITQFLGAGTPQEAEAKRKIENLSVSVGQGKEVSQKNIDELRNFLTDAYNSRQTALVPGSKTGTVAKGGDFAERLKGLSLEKLKDGLARSQDPANRKMIEDEIARKSK